MFTLLGTWDSKSCEIVQNLSLRNKFANDCDKLECVERCVTSCVYACVCARDNVIRRKWHVQKWSPVTMLPTTTRINTAQCPTYTVSTIINVSYRELGVYNRGTGKVTVSWVGHLPAECWYLPIKPRGAITCYGLLENMSYHNRKLGGAGMGPTPLHCFFYIRLVFLATEFEEQIKI
jgi:hypothetical protein